VCDLIAAGATGCVLKSEEVETLAHAIRTVAGGGTWFSRPILEKLIQSKADIAVLTQVRYARTQFHQAFRF
jgi:DNA-binding NarL/FixJ family response regulator